MSLPIKNMCGTDFMKKPRMLLDASYKRLKKEILFLKDNMNLMPKAQTILIIAEISLKNTMIV
jgi:hypothetical protein